MRLNESKINLKIPRLKKSFYLKSATFLRIKIMVSHAPPPPRKPQIHSRLGIQRANLKAQRQLYPNVTVASTAALLEQAISHLTLTSSTTAVASTVALTASHSANSQLPNTMLSPPQHN